MNRDRSGPFSDGGFAARAEAAIIQVTERPPKRATKWRLFALDPSAADAIIAGGTRVGRAQGGLGRDSSGNDPAGCSTGSIEFRSARYRFLRVTC